MMRPTLRASHVTQNLALLLTLGACRTAQPTEVQPTSSITAAASAQADDWRAEVDAVCAEWSAPGTPGCALGVIRDGRLAHARGYGMADLEQEIEITPRTVFDIASTSKQFTAACIGLLQQDGALSIDDDLRRWVPEIPDYGSKITLRHLLHHTSGLRDYLELFAFAGRKTEDWTTGAQALAVLSRQKALNFEPGAEHLYSNSGYFLLSVVVERASGRSLARFAKERIFEPLEMHDTLYHDDHTRVVPRRATGYSPRAGGGWAIAMSDFEQTGDGSVMTTVEDLAKWDANFYTRQVGGDELQRFLHERGRLNDGEELDYAAGLSIDTFRGLARVSHGGAWAGYRAQLVRFPEQRCSVVCLANLDSIDPSDVCARVAGIVLREHMTNERRDDDPRRRRPRDEGDEAEVSTAPGPDGLAEYAGMYESEELEVRAQIVVRDGRLFIGEAGLADFELPPRAHDRFGPPGAAFAFARDDSGQLTGFHASSGRMRNLWFARMRR